MDILAADWANYLPEVDARAKSHVGQDELLLVVQFLFFGIIFALLFLFRDCDLEATVRYCNRGLLLWTWHCGLEPQDAHVVLKAPDAGWVLQLALDL